MLLLATCLASLEALKLDDSLPALGPSHIFFILPSVDSLGYHVLPEVLIDLLFKRFDAWTIGKKTKCVYLPPFLKFPRKLYCPRTYTLHSRTVIPKCYAW